jgi:hypothetical protein
VGGGEGVGLGNGVGVGSGVGLGGSVGVSVGEGVSVGTGDGDGKGEKGVGVRSDMGTANPRAGAWGENSTIPSATPRKARSNRITNRKSSPRPKEEFCVIINFLNGLRYTIKRDMSKDDHLS